MDSSNITNSTLNSINHLVGRIQYLEQQIDNLQAFNADLQAAYADLSAYNNYLLRSLVNSPDPDTVPQTVLEIEEQPNEMLREESSDEQLVFRTFESSPFIGNSDGSASDEETNSLLETYQDRKFLVPLEDY